MANFPPFSCPGKAKYPAIEEAEEAVSRPLSAALLAVFDATLVHVLNTVAAGHNADWQKIRKDMCAALNDKKHERTAAILESTTYADCDVIFLQESSATFKAFAEGRALGEAYDFLAPENADPNRDQNSLVLLRKASAWGPATDASAAIADALAAKAKADGLKSPAAPGDVAAFETSLAGKPFLLASFHGDTNGLATAPVLDALDAYKRKESDDAVLLFGLDANVYGAEAEGKYFVGDFAAHFGGLGLSDVYGRNPDPKTYTTFNARTYLQPQLNKAVKPEDKFTSPLVDRNPKDHILFYEKDAKLAAPPTRDNTGRGFYDNDIMFPTLTFPSDHAITKAAVALVAAD